VRWFRTAAESPAAPKVERAAAAFGAARVLRDQLHREAEAEPLFRIACEAGNPEACLEVGERPRARMRRKLGR